ncbi:MAG: hypothetical protein JO107_12145 [Hyphomicrobiales bacterium]|nr:hypothetical protein [Hyphomicrobiales bacterium]
MARQTVALYALNRGEIDPLALSRVDQEHLRLAAQIQCNWLPRVLGPMMLRPGSEQIGVVYQSSPAKAVPFIAAFDDTAEIELTNYLMRVWVDDALVTRASVGTVVPGFNSGLWTTAATGTASVVYSAAGCTISSVNIGAVATATAAVTVAAQDQGVEHGLRVIVTNGPIILRIGSTSGGNDVFYDETLDTGTYSMAFTPPVGAGTIYVQLNSTVSPENFNTKTTTQPQGIQAVTLQSLSIEGPGVMTLPTPWPQAVLAAPATLRYTQSADVIFLAAPGLPQYQINRYSPHSWSIVLYKPVKGPMNATSGSNSVQLTPSVSTGNGTLTANQPFFDPGFVGALMRLFHNGQDIGSILSFGNTYTDCIQVYGVSTTSLIVSGSVQDIACNDRIFGFSIVGTWSGTITLERSYEGPTSGFTPYLSFTSNQSNYQVNDGLNNEIVWYRLGFAPGGYVSGSASCSFAYGGGGGPGVCHITGYVSPTQVQIEILVPFYNTSAAWDWHLSEWSGDEGYPTSTAIHEGRLWWAGADRWWGSTSDDYTNFDFDAEGDASYIDVSVGQGPIATINWLLSLDNLLGGADTSIISARSDAIQDPLTPTNFNLRFSVTTGSAPVQGVRLDNRGIYVDQSTSKLFEATYDLYSYNYLATELSNLNPGIGFAGYVGMAIQRNPDTRIYLIRADGQIVIFLYDVADQVKAFVRYQTAGNYEDVIVMPGVVEDRVYVIVNRNGVRYLEKFALMSECQGGNLSKLADCHGVYSSATTPTNQISAPWLAGQSVVCWADGADISPIQLDANGNATLPNSYYNLCYGLGYKAPFLSAKLAYAAKLGTAINQIKRVDHVGFVLQNTHYQGLKYGSYHLNPFVASNATGNFNSDFGPDFASAVAAQWDQGAPLDNLPLVELGAALPENSVWAYYDQKQIEFPGDPDTDSRLYLEANAPRPCTVVGVTIAIETSN